MGHGRNRKDYQVMIKFMKFITRMIFRLMAVVALYIFVYALLMVVQTHGIMHVVWTLVNVIGICIVCSLLIALGDWAFKRY